LRRDLDGRIFVKLLMKFNVIFVLVFGTGLGLAGYLSWRYLQEDARSQVMQQARLMMAAAFSARDYTTKQIKPLLLDNEMHRTNFLPQTVPAYAATESFGYLRGRYPDYTYKEATLNPTNPRDRATDWEADVVNDFRNHPGTKEVIGERETPAGTAMFLAHPISVDPPCLSCHDTADDAPTAMIRRYGSANGFGWHAGDIVGAQIVSVPMTLPVQLAGRAFRGMLLYLAAIFLVTLLLLNLLLMVTIIQPVARLSAMADQISTGNMDVPELPVDGQDEINVLAGSFNRMRRSLEQALRMLGE
jgi:HAMP domain-containing protein